jgi:hypothetical protein
MTKILLRMFCGGVASLAIFTASDAYAVFSQIAEDKAVLSVDINGGGSGNNRTQLGWDGTTVGPVGIDNTPGPPVGNGAPFVTWQPWGGSAGQGGDNFTWPNFPATGTSLSHNKTFSSDIGLINVKISSTGTLSNYANGGNIDSRDRGPLAETDHGGTAGDLANENKIGRQMYRDLIFAGGSGTNIRGTNFLEMEISGLNPGSPYKVNLYSYDRASHGSGVRQMNYSATAPYANTSGGALDGHLGYWVPGGSGFQAPADMVATIWTPPATAGENSLGLPGPALLSVKADTNGIAKVWLWGRTGTDGVTNAGNGQLETNFSDTTYLNGFQIAIPEPGSMVLGLIGLGSMLVGRRRD